MKNIKSQLQYDKVPVKLSIYLRSLSLVLMLFLCGPLLTYAQDDIPLMDQQITLDLNNVSIQEVVNSIESLTTATFYFKEEDHTDQSYSVQAESDTLSIVLDKLFAPTDYSYVVYRDNYINIVPNFLATDEFSVAYFQLLENNLNQSNTENKKASDGLVIGDINNIPPSGIAKVTGTVIDGTTGEEIIGATIQWLDTPSAGITDAFGNFETQIEIGTHIVQAQYIGYQTLSKKVNVLSDGQLSLEMFNQSISLEEIVIRETASNNKVESEQILSLIHI